MMVMAGHGEALQKKEGEDLRVLSYNIHMWEPGVEALAGVIKAADADIVGLNEAWNEERSMAVAKALGYNIVYGGQTPPAPMPPKAHWINDHYMPQVLLTRLRIVSSQVFNAVEAGKDAGNRDVDPAVPIYRGGVLAVLETAAGNRVVVFVLHLHPWGNGGNEKMTTMRLEEIKGILRKLEPYRDLPVVVLGDFNTQSHRDGKTGWKVTRHLESQGYSDLYRTLNPDPEAKPGLTWPDSRIDYIFYNRHVGPVDCRVLEDGVFGSRGYKLSDHLALFGVLRVGL